MDLVNQPAQKLDNELLQQTEKTYQDFMKKEQERVDAEKAAQTAAKFDEVRQLGFATSKDIDSTIQAYFGKFMETVERLEKENTALREWVMRKAAQGTNSGVLDQTGEQKNDEIAKKFARPFM